jgi:DNA invertase Pin-like site-specific DNA recombinase
MSKQKRIGVSYARFSDPKQAKGDSKERQAEMFRDFCARHDLTPHPGKPYLDPGRSGYTDAHRQKGELGRLIAAAKDGAFPPGTVIVVEAWDRLGRLRPDRQTELIAELLRTGVSIGVCRLNDIFTEEDFGTHKWTTLSVFVQLAYQESKQKSERVAHSWKKRREKAREDGTPVTGRLPAWLKKVKRKRKPVEIKERVAAVKRIFELAAPNGDDRRGRSKIIRTLIKEKVPPFGGRTDKWSSSYIHKILIDRRVLGEYQPRTTDGKPAGDVIEGYYPRVIEDDVWELAQRGQEERRGKDRLGRALARGERKHVNLFRGLLTNATDGERFFLSQRRDGGHILRSSAGVEGRGRTVTFPYDIFEEAVLRLLREVPAGDVLPRAGDTSRLDVLTARHDRLRADVAALKADLDAGYSKALSDLLRKKEAEAEEAGELVRKETARVGATTAVEAWERLPELADMVKTGGDPVRLRLRPVLRRIITTMRVLVVRKGSRTVCAVQAHFDGGARRDWLIVHQPAGHGRPCRWGVCSDAGRVGGAATLFGDLSSKRAVEWLERAVADEVPGIDLMSFLDDEPGADDREARRLAEGFRPVTEADERRERRRGR